MLSQSKIITYLSTVLHCIENGAEKMRSFMYHILFQREEGTTEHHKKLSPTGTKHAIPKVFSSPAAQDKWRSLSLVQTMLPWHFYPFQPFPTILSAPLLPQVKTFPFSFAFYSVSFPAVFQIQTVVGTEQANSSFPSSEASEPQ